MSKEKVGREGAPRKVLLLDAREYALRVVGGICSFAD